MSAIARSASRFVSSLLASAAADALTKYLDSARIGIVDDQPVMVTHKRPDQTWEEAVTEAEQKADGVKTPWVTPELIEVTVERSRGGGWSKPVTDPHCTSVTDSEPDAVPSAEALTATELNALPVWSVVETWGHDWVKTTIGWVAVGDEDTDHAEDLIRIWGPVTLVHRAPGPDDLVIKRDERWHPGYLRTWAAELDVRGAKSAAGVVRTVSEALEAEQ